MLFHQQLISSSLQIVKEVYYLFISRRNNICPAWRLTYWSHYEVLGHSGKNFALNKRRKCLFDCCAEKRGKMKERKKETMKRARACRQNVNIDWISRLPDDLLIRILSLLTTKEAVRSCILSKRWKRVWADLPILKFNINEFGVDDSIGGTAEALRLSIAKFEFFVSDVVENRESTHIDRVSYVHDTKRTSFYNVPMQWLDRVALLMPRLIDISIARVNSLDLPDSLFSCATLQHLKINLHAVKKITIIPASIYLPSLKVFSINGVELHENFAQKLLMGCPSLLQLHLCSCDLYFTCIFSNTLKDLVIVDCRQYEPMQISCPNLLSLYISSHHRDPGISLKNMKSLRRAGISLSSKARYFGGGEVSVMDFLSALFATQLIDLSLHINSPKLKVQLERGILNCRNFNNLKELFIVTWDICFDFKLVASLLKLSPNLKKLNLILDVSQVVIIEEQRQEVLGDILFQHKFIETVKIRDHLMRELPQDLIKT